MRPGQYVYATTDRSPSPRRGQLVRVLQETIAGPQWLVKWDGIDVPSPLAEQALAPWPPPAS